jgi:membrane protein YqaA with SNARE-associated domain
MLHRLVEIIKPFAAGLGGPGLALLAFLDSSFLSFPEVPDVLIVVSVTRNPSRWLYYASMTTIGSVLGCFVLYAVAKKGGEAFVRRRVKGRTFDRSLEIVRRYGLLAVVVPSILPPPAPFKIFVILAGLAGIGTGPFLGAIVIGRGLRYGIEALLAVRYGEAAMQYIAEHSARVSIWLAIAVAILGVAFILWRTMPRKNAAERDSG